MATKECVIELISLRHRALDLGMTDTIPATTVYNDNQAAVIWTRSQSIKGTKHINLRETRVQEEQQYSKSVNIKHIPGLINPADIFTKEIRAGAHFCHLRDLMMVSMSNFLKHHHTIPSHLSSPSTLPYYCIRNTNPPTAFVS